MTAMACLLAATLAGVPTEAATNKTVTITSDRADYDRKAGVILLDGHVAVEDPEFTMHSDRLHVFVDGTNQLKRIVVTGNVAITNGLRNGACDRATFVRDLHRVIMFGVPGRPARLVDDSRRRSVVEGSKITFWTDSEQVEVETPTILLDGGLPTGDVLGAVQGEPDKDEKDLTARTDKEEKE